MQAVGDIREVLAELGFGGVLFRTVENQGEVTADNIEVTDYLPTGLSLSANATGWTDNNDGTATFEVDGELAPGDRKSVV